MQNPEKFKTGDHQSYFARPPEKNTCSTATFIFVPWGTYSPSLQKTWLHPEQAQWFCPGFTMPTHSFWLLCLQHSKTPTHSKYSCPDYFEHATTVLFPADAPALALAACINYKIATVTHKVLNFNQQLHITHLCNPYTPSRRTCTRFQSLQFPPS